MATNQVPTAWLNEDDEWIATVLDIYEERARQAERAKRKG